MATYSRPSEPLSIGGVLDDGLRLYRVSLRPLFPLALLLALASEGLNAEMMLLVDPRDPASIIAAFDTLAPAMLIVFIIACFMYAAMIGRLARIAAGEASTLSQAFRLGAARFLPLFLSWVLWSLAIVAGSILLVIPGMYLMVTLSFMSFPLVLDGSGPLASLGMSHRLVAGSWWRTATLMTVAALIAMLPYLVVTLGLGFVIALMSSGKSVGWAIVQWLLASLVYAFVAPMLLCLMYSIYRDLLLRKGREPSPQ